MKTMDSLKEVNRWCDMRIFQRLAGQQKAKLTTQFDGLKIVKCWRHEKRHAECS